MLNQREIYQKDQTSPRRGNAYYNKLEGPNSDGCKDKYDWQFHNSSSFQCSLFPICLTISNKETRMAEIPVLNGYAPFPSLLTGSTHS